MGAIELACGAIVAVFLVVRARMEARPGRLLRRLALMAAAGWIGEESCIRLHGFYFYDRAWSAFIGHVPLMILVIWPVVIQSARDVAGAALGPRPGSAAQARGLWPRAGVTLLGAAIVLADASLIEPIAVQARLWSWTEPGLFAVPPIGILGWAYFAAACLVLFDTSDRRGGGLAFDALVLVVAPAATHALLIATWWGALRWVSGSIAPWPAVALAWAIALPLAARAWQAGTRRRIPRAVMLLRVPAAGFFFVLLAVRGRDVLPLVAYALAFAPPYLAVTSWRPGVGFVGHEPS